MSSTRHSDRFAQAVPAALDQMKSIPGSDIWPLSERLSAFFFMLLDGVEEAALTMEPGNALAAFRREASGFFSPFQDALRDTLPLVGRASDVGSVNKWVADLPPNRVVLAEAMVQLIQATLADTSEERQRSAALADRVLSLVASLGATPIPGRIVDVIRYSIEAGYVPLADFPGIGEWLKPAAGSNQDQPEAGIEDEPSDHQEEQSNG